MPPLEFVVEGTPKSVNSPGKHDRRAKQIRRAARKACPRRFTPLRGPLAVRLVYCFEATDLDADNIIKRTLDALVGTLYVDDSQFADVVVSFRTFVEASLLEDPPPLLVRELSRLGMDFLYVKISQVEKKKLP